MLQPVLTMESLPQQTAKQEKTSTQCFTSLRELKADVNQYLCQRKLSQSQQQVVGRVLCFFWPLRKHGTSAGQNSFDANLVSSFFACNSIKAPQLLITGDPGSGKSYVIETIRELASLMNLGHVATCSCNGIAAVNIDGNTICTLFKINDRSSSNKCWKLNDNALLELKLKLCAGILCAVIIDEVSTIDTRIVALVSCCLQQIMNNFDAPFGGLPIFFFGDFNQLGPVQKTFIPKDMLTWAVRNAQASRHKKTKSPVTVITSPKKMCPIKSSAATFKKNLKATFAKKPSKSTANQTRQEAANKFKPGSLPHLGCRLFSDLEQFHLVEQQRSDDPTHNEFVQKLSRGECIALSDILGYQHLSKRDVEDHPNEWKFAPVLVSTNIERLNINRAKAKLWAIHHKTHVFKWKTKLGKQVNRPPLDELPAIHEENAFFWQFFVAKAPCNLNHSINPDLALVNGAPLEAHSVTFASSEEQLCIHNLLQSSDCPSFGEEIEIQEPISVNFIVIPSLDGKQISSIRKRQLSALSTLTNTMPRHNSSDIVIPITAKMHSKASSDWNRFSFSTQNLLTPIGTVQVLEPFPFDLGFAMTVHKAQGRTIKRVVLDLVDHPNHFTRMNFAAVFVAMSRVGSSKHIRLLPHSKLGTKFNPVDAYQYLTSLQPDKDSQAFCHGFAFKHGVTQDGAHWDPKLALSCPGFHN